MQAAAETPPVSADGLSSAGIFRRMGETFLSVLHNRLELLTLELKEEKHWAVNTLILAVLAASFAILSIVAVFITIAVLVPESARPWVMVGISVVMIGGLVTCFLLLKSRLSRPPMLQETLAELKKDIACLKD